MNSNILLEKDTKSSNTSIGKRLINATIALTFARGISRAMDLVRTLFIAAWVGPAEMGIYGLAVLVLSALDQLSETGLLHALIQKQDNIKQFIAPARTLLFFRGLLLSVIALLTAPLISAAFGKKEATLVLQVMSVIPLIRGLEPLTLTLAKKELHFRPMAVIKIISAIIGAVVGLIMAWIKPDAWALVSANVSAVMINTVGVWLISNKHEKSFSLNLSVLHPLHKFGFWIFVNGIASYIFVKAGEWIIGISLSVEELAIYQMAYLLSSAITNELGAVIGQVFFPGLCKIQSDILSLRTTFQKSFGLLAICTLGIAAIVCVLAPYLVTIVLGQKWNTVLPLIPWLTIWGVCSVFAGGLQSLMQAIGRPALWVCTVLGMLLCLCIGLYPMTKLYHSLGAAMLLAMIGIIAQIVRYGIVAKMLSVTWWFVFSHILVPLIGCFASVIITKQILNIFDGISVFSSFLIALISSLTFYVGVLYLGSAWLQPPLKEIKYRLENYLFSRKKI